MIRLHDWPIAWQPWLSEQQTRLDAMAQWLEERAAQRPILPPDPLRLFRLIEPDRVRVVILGQDPYHGIGQANGLAFSVAPGVALPPSLRNILAEARADLGSCQCESGQLEPWVEQGVLLLNSVLTVEPGMPGAHIGLGWEPLVQTVLARLAERPLAWLLWGQAAARVADPVLAASALAHYVLRANHPSPLSARRAPLPFLGSRPFSQVNAWLRARGEPPISW